MAPYFIAFCLKSFLVFFLIISSIGFNLSLNTKDFFLVFNQLESLLFKFQTTTFRPPIASLLLITPLLASLLLIAFFIVWKPRIRVFKLRFITN